ncbi:hypothetical protein BGZ72_008896 [Mortierella alpina]|nr:hypothetical protein BGZ72_008896 [Mortierella alpina]
MVTTRSRGIKPEPGLDTATGNLPTAASGQLKRKNSTSSTTADVPKKMQKSDLTDLDSDLSAEAKLPSAPAPTPAIGNSKSTAAVHEAQPPLDGDFTTTSSNGPGQNPTPSAAAAISAHAPASIPAATTTTTITTTTTPLAPVKDDSITAALETVKEPEPQFAPLPELETVLDEPPRDTATTAAPLLSTPAAPTAPEFSTIPAPAPVLAAPGPASGASATSTEDPTLHQQQKATSSLPSPMQSLDNNTPHLAHPGQYHSNGGALGNNGNNNGLLSSTLAGIDSASHSANALAADATKGYGHTPSNGGGVEQNDPSSEPFVLKPPSNTLAGPFTSQI